LITGTSNTGENIKMWSVILTVLWDNVLMIVILVSVLEDSINRAQIKLTDVADHVQGDWVILAHQLDITNAEIDTINHEYNTVNDQALAMLQLWVKKKGPDATGNNTAEI